ncbi:MAG: cation transporting ATPase C-terminal domain-containing protein, partial [Betaproteobacteria bacterium]|nr:cation transporting ATPase C-terminal domain-containing protein [Betaproteobacteria bacterium]
LFRTGWFVESIATQVLVIFIIRTRRNPFHSHPNRWLTVTSLSIVAIAMLLPLSPLAEYLGFTPLPTLFFGLLTILIIAYLLTVEYCKQWFYQRLNKSSTT